MLKSQVPWFSFSFLPLVTGTGGRQVRGPADFSHACDARFWGITEARAHRKTGYPDRSKKGRLQITQQMNSTLASVVTYFKCACSDSETTPHF